MHPTKVDRRRLHQFTDLPNVGKAFAKDLELLGFTAPAQLKGQDPVQLYDRLSELTRTRQDPCVLDTLMSITRFMDGDPPRVWWHYTDERKRLMAARDRGNA
ncbi:MAG: helix-hairpin-helix domain-containing protein [Gemmatimonadetes bacterium]|nr:helix-hairpin-helix domain-containing protein [Gemmatimonadota bacterium]